MSLSFLGILFFPMLLPSIEYSFKYFIITIITSIIITLLFLIIGTISNSVTQSQIFAFPLLLLTMFLPILSLNSETIAEIAKYTYMGGYNELFNSSYNTLYTSLPFFMLIIWFIAVMIISMFCYKKFVFKN